MSDVLHAPSWHPASARPAGSAGPVATLDDLSPRELDVLRLIVNGYSNEEIARELYITINTVKTFIRTAYRKIGATKRTQAIIWGFTQGLLDESGVAA